jgi:predicted ATPase with chaperone activity
MMDELLSLKATDKEERDQARGRHEVSQEVRRAVAKAHAAELLRLRDKGELNDVTYMDLLLELDRENPEYVQAGTGGHGT